jgi:hypothetical protein
LMHKDSMEMKVSFVLAKCKSWVRRVEHSEMNASATDHAKHCNYGFFLTLRKLHPDTTRNHLILKIKSIPLLTLFHQRIKMMVTRFGSTKTFFHLGIFDNSNTTYQVQILITVFIYFNRRRNNG